MHEWCNDNIRHNNTCTHTKKYTHERSEAKSFKLRFYLIFVEDEGKSGKGIMSERKSAGQKIWTKVRTSEKVGWDKKKLMRSFS